MKREIGLLLLMKQMHISEEEFSHLLSINMDIHAFDLSKKFIEGFLSRLKLRPNPNDADVISKNLTYLSSRLDLPTTANNLNELFSRANKDKDLTDKEMFLVTRIDLLQRNIDSPANSESVAKPQRSSQP